MPITNPFSRKKGKELAATAPRPRLNGTSLNKILITENYRSLEEAYVKLAESEEVKEKLRKVFRTLRIMVVGRSGSGKTTIIRLVMGEKGPRSMAVGKAGVQDISVEWHHPDEDVPLVFHDSNGMDVLGPGRLEDIKRFLDPNQKDHDADFCAKVHVVWYVFSAIDNRFLEDGGLLAMLDASYATLPIIFVMTHCDVHDTMKRPIVDDAKLEVLLGRIADPARRQRARSRMVKLSNEVQQSDTDGSIQGTVDIAGLKLLIQNTKEVIGKELRLTWAAGQANDMDEKLNTSTQLIVSVKRKTIVQTWVVGTMPMLQQLQLTRALFTMTKCLGKIWKVHPNLEKAILDELFQKEGGKGVLKNLLYDVGAVIGLGGTVAAVVLTGGIATLLISVYIASAFAQTRGVSRLIMVYSLLVMGVILYIRAHKPVVGADTHRQQQQADGDKIGVTCTDTAAAATSTTPDVHHYVHYSQLCQNFTTSQQALHLKSFMEQNQALWRSPLDTIEQTQRLKNALLNCFKQIALNRPRSLYNALLREDDMNTVNQRHGHTGPNYNKPNTSSGGARGSTTASWPPNSSDQCDRRQLEEQMHELLHTSCNANDNINTGDAVNDDADYADVDVTDIEDDFDIF